MALASPELLQRGKALFPLMCVRIPNEPYLIKALTTLSCEGILYTSMSSHPHIELMSVFSMPSGH